MSASLTIEFLLWSSPFLQSRQEFVNLLHLSTIDVVSIKLWFDKKVIASDKIYFICQEVIHIVLTYFVFGDMKCQITIPKVANVCSGFDDPSRWTFFDLTSIYDDYADKSTTIVEAEFVCFNFKSTTP